MDPILKILHINLQFVFLKDIPGNNNHKLAKNPVFVNILNLRLTCRRNTLAISLGSLTLPSSS